MIRIATVTAWIWLAGERDAWAYLDPGSGSMLLQMILGGLAAFFFTLKLYWKKWTSFFSRKKNSDAPRKPGDPPVR